MGEDHFGTLSRRSVLAGSLGALAATATPALAQSRAYGGATAVARRDHRARHRVAVIGAGLAGLTTALDLRAAGWDVVVLEARDRVGGRVHTSGPIGESGLHAELGGESIDDGHYAMHAMLRRFGIGTERRWPVKPFDSTVYYRGRRVPLAAFLARRGGAVLTDYLRADDALSALGNGVDPEHPERAPHAHRLDSTSLETFVRRLKLAPEAEFIVRLQNRGEYNAELRDISLLFVAQQAAVVTGGVDPTGLTGWETERVNGGNSRLPRAMARELGPIVRTGSPVLRVDHDRHGVRVHTAHGHVDAAWCVVAAPFMPMRRVRFAPALPASLAAAVDGLDLGHAVKVVREYDAAFWRAEGSSGFTITDLPFAIAWSPTDSRPDTVRGLMSQFVTGDAAVHAARLRRDERIRSFTGQLDTVYPEGVPLRGPAAETVAWMNERYTGGGYAVYKPGQMAAYWPALRQGHGRIRFAGEHTESLAGYMESAIRSGHRVAASLGRPRG